MNTKAFYTAVCLLVFMGAAGAADEPARKFLIVGTLDRVDAEKGEIVIGDRLYHLSPNVKVSGDRRHGSQTRTLRLGTKVGANSFSGTSNGWSGQYVYEIRVFPDNFDLDSVAAKDD
jgi:hypothetical protein